MTLYIPEGRGVPGFEDAGQRAPQWWDPNGARKYDADINASTGLPEDPRWNQATRHDYSSGTTTEATIRGLYMTETAADGTQQPVLYLSFQVIGDPNANAPNDCVFIGLVGASGKPAVFVIPAYDALTAGPQAPSGFKYWTAANTSATTYSNVPWPQGEMPLWVQNMARGWVTNFGDQQAQSLTWALNVRIPGLGSSVHGDFSDDGVIFGANPLIYVTIAKDTTAGTVPYVWPRSLAAPVKGLTGMTFPAASSWDALSFGGGGAGISIANQYTDIGNDNPTGDTGKIAFNPSHDVTNTLWVDVTNTGPQIAKNTLRVRFRLADWGSQPWPDQLTEAEGVWNEVDPQFVKHNAADIPTNATGTQRRISYAWDVTPAVAQPWISNQKPDHQCILVELSSDGGQQYDFVQDSAFHNFTWTQVNSTIQDRPAIALPKAAARPGVLGRLPFLNTTNVYVLMQTSNAPYVVSAGRPLPPKVLPPGTSFKQPLLGQHVSEALNIRIGPNEPVTIGHLIETMTTVRYYVFHSTGQSITLISGDRPLLARQTSFGYFVQHARPIYGWDFGLAGNFKSLGSNMYQTSMPAGSTKVIGTTITGYETQPPAKRPPTILPAIAGGAIAKVPIVNRLRR